MFHVLLGESGSETNCGALGFAGFLFRFLQLSSDCAGLNRQDRSLRYNGGPKTEPFHRAARQSTVSNRSESTNVRNGHQNTELQFTRMAIAPNVDRKHRHHTGHIKSHILYNN